MKKGIILYQHSGPTENTVVATSYHVKWKLESKPNLKPISNSQVKKLDSKKADAVRYAGELCISGDGLARYI
jgi:non-ribosomal peptide synthetase component F